MTQLLLLFIIFIMSKSRSDISHIAEALMFFNGTAKKHTVNLVFLLKILGNALDTFKIQNQAFCYGISHGIYDTMSQGYSY